MARGETTAKRLMKQFVAVEMEATFSFMTEAGKGHDMIRRIRVELSRIRGKLLAARYKLREFKMLVVSVETKDGKDHVTLKKSQTAVQATLEVLPELLVPGKKLTQAGGSNGPQSADRAIAERADVK